MTVAIYTLSGDTYSRRGVYDDADGWRDLDESWTPESPPAGVTEDLLMDWYDGPHIIAVRFDGETNDVAESFAVGSNPMTASEAQPA